MTPVQPKVGSRAHVPAGRGRDAKAYRDYLTHKVAVAHAQKAAGPFASNEDVEAKAKIGRKM